MNYNQKPANAEANLTLSWRIGLANWDTDEAFAHTLRLLGEYAPVVDEVTLFETITHHLYIPLDEYENRMKLAKARLDAFRQAGVSSVGINVLCTIGHINEAWSYMPPLPFQTMIGHNGDAALGSACPNTPELRKYIRDKYILVAEANPDFIWVDDDIRMHAHGIAWGCFCSTCLDIFAKKAGRKFSREELVAAFDVPSEGALRELWIEQNIETIESLMAHVREAIDSVNPKIEKGLMTAGPGWTTYSGLAFDRWFKALGATKARPGGGFYTDAAPMAMYHKAIDCGFQRTLLPACVTDVQYELENFPYQLFQKSATAVVNECTLALGTGMNGIAFNMMGTPAAEQDLRPWMQRIPAARSLWEKWNAHTAGLPTAGLWPAWSSQLMAKRTVRPKESWFASSLQHESNRVKILGEMGLPLSADAPGCGVILYGRMAEAFSDDELKRMMAGGVIMDSISLEILEERGLGHLTGVKIAKRFDNGMIERFTADELNGTAVGQIRDARIEFYGDAKGMADVLEPVGDGVRILATLEDFFYREQGPCMTAYENELGGRVVVMGYSQWMCIHSVAKRTQLQNAADWVSRGTMPLRVEQPVPLVSIVRQSAGNSRSAVLLMNGGMDTISNVTVQLRMNAGHATMLELGREDCMLQLTPEKSGVSIALQYLQPWSMRAILLEK